MKTADKCPENIRAVPAPTSVAQSVPDLADIQGPKVLPGRRAVLELPESEAQLALLGHKDLLELLGLLDLSAPLALQESA